jgi:hypothetical protein
MKYFQLKTISYHSSSSHQEFVSNRFELAAKINNYDK